MRWVFLTFCLLGDLLVSRGNMQKSPFFRSLISGAGGILQLGLSLTG